MITNRLHDCHNQLFVYYNLQMIHSNTDLITKISDKRIDSILVYKLLVVILISYQFYIVINVLTTY